jgi:hypothetical protein
MGLWKQFQDAVANRTAALSASVSKSSASGSEQRLINTVPFPVHFGCALTML